MRFSLYSESTTGDQLHMDIAFRLAPCPGGFALPSSCAENDTVRQKTWTHHVCVSTHLRARPYTHTHTHTHTHKLIMESAYQCECSWLHDCSGPLSRVQGSQAYAYIWMQTVLFLCQRLFSAAPGRHLCTKIAAALAPRITIRSRTTRMRKDMPGRCCYG